VVLVGMVIPPNYGPRYGQEFRDMFASLAAKHPVGFVPFLLDQVALRSEWMQADGIHANALGQPQMLENVWPKLKPLLVAPGKPAS
jgi:acyl-CoA thioesterase-1